MILLVTMLNLLLWWPVLLATAVQTLTIDSQLGTSIEDCFERISIGEQLFPDAIYRNITELTTRECEQLCKQDKQCQTYDYGVGAKGNATCNLSTLGEKELRDQNLFRRHPDYDIYIRRFQCEQSPPSPLQPQFDEENPPLHRPVFRPDEDEPKNPLSDDYLTDLRPFETRPDFHRPYKPRPPNNHIDTERPDDYDSSKPDFDRPPSYGAHMPPVIPFRPEKPFRPDHYRPDRPFRPDDPYRPERPLRPDEPYGPQRPLRPDDPYIPVRPSNPYGPESPSRPDDPYRPDRPWRPASPYGERPLRPDDPYRPEIPRPEEPYRPGRPDPYRPQRPIHDDPYSPQKPYRPGYPDKPYNQSHSKPDPYDVLQFQDHYGRPPRPDPGLWRPDPHYPPLPNDDIQDVYGPKPIKPERPPYKPEEPEYHYIVRPNKKPLIPKPQDDGYNKPSQDPYKPNKPDYEYDRPDPYVPNKPDPYPENGDSGYGNKPPQDYPNKPSNDHKPKPDYPAKPDPYNPGPVGPIGPPDRPYRPSRPYDYAYPSRPYEKPSYSYNSQYASGYGQNQDNSIYLEIYDPPRPYRPTKPLNDKPSYTSQGYGQNYGYGSGNYDSGHNSYGPIQNSHLYYGTQSQSGLYGQNYNRPIEDDRPQKPSHGQSSYGGSQNSDQAYGSQSSAYGNHKPQDYKPSYGGNQASYGQNDDSNQYGSQNYGSNRPSYGLDKPSYDTSHNRPSYGSSQEKPPSYGVQDKPSYGTQNYDNNRPYDSQKPQSGYQKPGTSQDPYNDNTDNSYGGQNYDNNQSYKPDPKPDNDSNYRPDVRPVYEYALDKPDDVPSYIVRPNGDIVTSRPVTVGDYGHKPGYADKPDYGDKPGYGDKPDYGEKPGYGNSPGYGDAGYREPGKLGSYKGEWKYVFVCEL